MRQPGPAWASRICARDSCPLSSKPNAITESASVRIDDSHGLPWHTQCTKACGGRELTKEDTMASSKQRRAARRNIKKAAAAAKRKHTLRKLPKRTRRAMGKEGAKARAARH